MLPTPASKLSSDKLVSPDNPSFRPLDIDTLYHTRAINSLRWSVDGEFLYFDTNITGRYNIWQVPSNGGWPAQLTVSDERNMLEDPSPDGRHLLYAQDEQGNEKPNLYLLSLDDYTVKNLTQTDKIGYRDMRWSPDGRSLIFAAERESPGAYPIWQMDPATGTVKKIVTNEAGDCEYLEYSPDGKKIAYSTTRNYQYTGVRVKDLEAGAETVLAPIDDKSTTIVQGWTRDSKRVYVTSNANQQGIEAVALLELKENPEFKWLTLGQWDSQMVAVSDAEDKFAYIVNRAGNLRLLLRDSNCQLSLHPSQHQTGQFAPSHHLSTWRAAVGALQQLVSSTAILRQPRLCRDGAQLSRLDRLRPRVHRIVEEGLRRRRPEGSSRSDRVSQENRLR